MKIMSALEMAVKFEALSRELKATEPAIVARACQMVCAEAKRVLGTHDYDWAPLSAATLARKTADAPLLETGEMRDSIEWQSKGNEGHVGSDNDKAVFQELGTLHIPPRSFLMQAAVHMEPKIHKMATRAVIAAVSGGRHSPVMAELIHIIKHVGHDLKEAAHEMRDGDKDD